MLSCTGGAGYFFGETDFWDSFPFLNSEVHQGEKKISVVKPKSFYSKRKSDFTGSKNEQFSFFPVLNDPSMSKMVGLDGKIFNRYEFSQVPVRKVYSGEKIHRKTSVPVSPLRIEKASLKLTVPHISSSIPNKAEVEAGREQSNQHQKTLHVVSNFPPRGASALREGVEVGSALTRGPASSWSHVGAGSSGTLVSFVVQVSSFRQRQRAEVLRGALEKKGYAAFIGKTELPDNRGTWYRVYIGRYFNRTGAERAASRFYREENRQAMVIRQTG